MAARFLCLLACSITGFCAVLVIIGDCRASDSKNWPTTHGTVVAFRAKPNYQYAVPSGNFTNDYVSCNELFGLSRELTDSEKYAVRYPLNGKVTVHYHPTKPDISVLETKFNSATFWKETALLIVIVLVFGYGVIFAHWRRSSL
jgi:Protein of unknown function (DUF3592)